jgi:hypothetical protein
MTGQIYRTAQGKMVDMGALILQHEDVRAVGNMGVNARGDKIDSVGLPLVTRSEQVTKQYKQQVATESVVSSTAKSAQSAEQARIDRQLKREAMSRGEHVELSSEPSTGLAAAIAAAAKHKDEE